MLNDNSLRNFQCAVSKQIEHIIETPCQLSCGHLVCSKCIDSNESAIIECGVCGYKSNIDASNSLLPIEQIDQMIEANLKQISEFVLLKMKTLQDKFKEKSNEVNKKIGNHYEHVVSEIDVYIESLKEKLDVFGAILKQQLDESRENVEESFKLSVTEVNQFENDIKALTQEINSLNLDLKTFKSFNAKLKDFKGFDQIENFKFKIKFHPEEVLSHLNTIGHVVCSHVDESQLNYFASQIVNSKIKWTEFEFEPYVMVQLKNSNLLVLPSEWNNLKLYDLDFNLVQTIETINNEKFEEIYSLAYDSKKDFLFVSTRTKLFKLNSDLSMVNVADDKGNQYDEIYIHGDRLYISDEKNRCIHFMFMETMEITESWFLNFELYQMTIIDDVICVSDCTNFDKLFYKLSTREYLHTYSNLGGDIMTYENKWFIGYDEHQWYIFDKNGEMKKKIREQYVFDEDDENCVREFFRTNDALYICMNNTIGRIPINQ